MLRPVLWSLARLDSCAQSALPALSRGAKASTYLAGVPVDPKADKNTPTRLKVLLRKVQEKIPEGVGYRTQVEKYVSRFLTTIESAPTQEDAEETLGRQYEEIQMDVDNELQVVEMMAVWKPWQTTGEGVRMFTNYVDVPSNMREFRDFQHDLAQKGE